MAPAPAASQLLHAPSSLAGLCIEERQSKILRICRERKHALEDVKAIVEESGCGDGALLCLPLLSGGPSSACLGALTVGFQTVADVTGPALQSALLLARSLAHEQRPALHEFCSLVSSMLLPATQQQPQPHSQDPGSNGSGSEDDYSGSDLDFPPDWSQSDTSDSGSEAENGAWVPGGRQVAGGPLHQLATPESKLGHPLLLQFSCRSVEHQFATYRATHLQRLDGVAYLICFCFVCMEAFLPGTAFQLPQHMGWWSIFGYLGLLPGLLLACKQTRPWFSAHRDWMLFATWCCSTCWVLAVKQYLRAGCITGWLTVMGLAFQMRFRFQALLALAVNAHLLPAISPRQLIHGVLLPLACCYVFEAHTRRLFVQAGSSSRRSRFSRRGLQ